MMRMQLVELSQQKIIISTKKQYFKSEVLTYAHAINMQACVEPKLN